MCGAVAWPPRLRFPFPASLNGNFITGIENREIVCGSREKPTDVTEWKGIQVNRETRNVTQLRWQCIGIEGSIDVQLSATVREVFLERNNLTGIVVYSSGRFISVLFRIKWKIFFDDNQFSSLLDLRKLPTSLTLLNAGSNRFSVLNTRVY
ncbi:transcriptional regulator protein [Perkinsela sp. CCAP 1560/4]|nr:transcriptional regulator protein [Perkinsela sp. CCAP 1560/4]|eukprot:KNH07327.1 transcriptional regulator protein [Perkinsela sp. CCAP 1560/4]